MYRSTKGASKARRDQINAEIRSLKDLLPISDADKARLSYLHIMSLACMYTRKSVFFSQGKRQSLNRKLPVDKLHNRLLYRLKGTAIFQLVWLMRGSNKCFSLITGNCFCLNFIDEKAI